jgi:hypothetical protein
MTPGAGLLIGAMGGSCGGGRRAGGGGGGIIGLFPSLFAIVYNFFVCCNKNRLKHPVLKRTVF